MAIEPTWDCQDIFLWRKRKLVVFYYMVSRLAIKLVKSRQWKYWPKETYRSREQNRSFKDRPTNVLLVTFYKSTRAIHGRFNKRNWNNYLSICQKEKGKRRNKERKEKKRKKFSLLCISCSIFKTKNGS